MSLPHQPELQEEFVRRPLTEAAVKKKKKKDEERGVEIVPTEEAKKLAESWVESMLAEAPSRRRKGKLSLGKRPLNRQQAQKQRVRGGQENVSAGSAAHDRASDVVEDSDDNDDDDVDEDDVEDGMQAGGVDVMSAESLDALKARPLRLGLGAKFLPHAQAVGSGMAAVDRSLRRHLAAASPVVPAGADLSFTLGPGRSWSSGNSVGRGGSVGSGVLRFGEQGRGASQSSRVSITPVAGREDHDGGGRNGDGDGSSEDEESRAAVFGKTRGRDRVDGIFGKVAGWTRDGGRKKSRKLQKQNKS